MKKLILLLLFIPLVLGAFDDPVTTTERTFTLEIEFNEPVNIVNNRGYLDSLPPLNIQRTITATNPSGDFTTYEFEVTAPLPNGDYEFTLDYQRREGNNPAIIPHMNIITVAAVQEDVPYLFEIELISPIPGFHNETEEFEIVLETGYPATCKYSFNSRREYDQMDNVDIKDSVGGITHVLNYTGSRNEQIYWIGCRTTDGSNLESYKEFLFGFTNGISEIQSVTQIPRPVIDKDARYADLRIVAEDKSICQITYTSPNGNTNYYPSNAKWDLMQENFSEYKVTNELRVCFISSTCDGLRVPESFTRLGTEKQGYIIDVNCLNRAWRDNSTSINVTVEYDTDARLSYVEPKRYVSSQPVLINLASQLNLDWCEYNLNDEFEDYEDWDDYEKNSARNFSIELTLDEGDYTIVSQCQQFGQQDLIKATKTFTVDRNKPSGFSYTLPATICKDKEFEVEWTAKDEISGIDKFYYEIFKDDKVIMDGSFGSKKDDIKIDEDAGSYKFSAWIKDEAGNIAVNSNKTFNLLNSSDVKCDDDSPEVVVTQKPNNGSTIFEVKCNDDGSGCKSAFKYDLKAGNKPSQADCNYSTSGQINTEYEAELTSILCYEVEDNAGNKKTGKEKITVNLEDVIDRCNNNKRDGDESDVDCGGSCTRCETGDSCIDNSDCKSSVCTENSVCSEEDFECYFDWECDSGKCEYPSCVEITDPDINVPGCTSSLECASNQECRNSICVDKNDPGPAPTSGGINWIAMTIGILGIIMLGGGGYFYFASPSIPSQSTNSSNIQTKKVPDLTINKNKTLDLKDTNKVKELRNKLSKDRGGSKRKNMLRAFETPDSTDRDLPAGTEKLNVDLIPKLKPKPAKKVPEIKSNTKKEQKKTSSNKKDESEEYLPIEKLSKKKDVFDELEDL